MSIHYFLRRAAVPLLSVALSIVCLSHISLAAGETEDMRFAKRLMSDGMYTAAAEEFMRFAEKYPRSLQRPEALLSAGESYMQAGKAVEALDVLDAFLKDYPDDAGACKARFYRGDILKALKRYGEAAEELLIIPDEYHDCPLVARALLDAGEYLLSAGDAAGAAVVLRRLINEHERSELIPRGRYSLALALEQIGRKLEAGTVLEKLVSSYPRSPVSALALLRLGERALTDGDIAGAREFYSKILSDFEEQSLQEKASFNLIEIYRFLSDDKRLIEESARYLGRHSDSKRRGAVYMNAINASRRLGKLDRALNLIGDMGAEGITDTTGELTLITGRVLGEKGKIDEAAATLGEFRKYYPRSPHRREALVLEAGLLRRMGRPREAARLYHLALLEGAGGAEQFDALSAIAAISVEDMGDTLAGLRYWDAVAAEDSGGDAAEEALWRANTLRQRIGDRSGAVRGFRELLRRFPGGTYTGEAERRIAYLDAAPVPDVRSMRRLARVAAGRLRPVERYLESAVILLDEAGDTDGAAGYLDLLLEQKLPDTLRAKTRYYLGKVHMTRYRIAVGKGRDAPEERREAISIWASVAGESAGSVWGERAHRAYIEENLAGWKPAEGLSRLEEYTRVYPRGPGKSWALSRKIDCLYELAGGGDEWAADSALSVYAELAAGGAPPAEMKEAALKRGYLLRIKGDAAGAAAAMEDFVAAYADDPRSMPVLYDLGETRLGLKEYERARSAYNRCLGSGPRISLAEKCVLRIGDCLYYLRRFEEAAATYGSFAGRFPGSTLGDEAIFRQALSYEWTGKRNEAEAILGRLAEKSDLTATLRTRVIRKLGASMLGRGEAAEATVFLEELVTLQRGALSLTLLGEAVQAGGDDRRAVKLFSDALKYENADSCRILAGRAKGYYGQNDFKRGAKDLDILESGCRDPNVRAGVLVEKGKVEMERGSVEDAASTLQHVRDTYPGTAEAAGALYYLAVCDLKRGGYEAAVQKLEALQAESPGTPIMDQVYFKLATAHYALGNKNLAAENYALSAEAAKDGDLAVLAWRNLGRVHQELGEWEKAAGAWKSITERFPEYEDIVEIFFNLGFSYSQAGRHEMAYEVFVRIPAVSRTEEQQGRAHYWSGIALKSLGRHAEAVREFLRVPYLKTGGMWGVTSKLEAGSCYELMGAVEQARKIYEDVLAAHGPGSDWGRVAREGLDRLAGGARPGAEEGRDGNGGNGPGAPGGGDGVKEGWDGS